MYGYYLYLYKKEGWSYLASVYVYDGRVSSKGEQKYKGHSLNI